MKSARVAYRVGQPKRGLPHCGPAAFPAEPSLHCSQRERFFFPTMAYEERGILGVHSEVLTRRE